MDQKGVANILLVAIVVVIVGVAEYFVLIKKQSVTPAPQTSPSPELQTGSFRIVSGNVAGQARCATQPRLTTDEVAAIAQKSKLSKQKGGWWVVNFSRGSSWRTNPFSDTCIWAVRSYAPASEGSDFGSFALDVTYIRDLSGEFYYSK